MKPKTGPVPGFAHIMVVSVIPNLSFALMSSIEAKYTDITLFTHCFRKLNLRRGFHFEPFKCLHHSHMNNTVNSFYVSIAQFILYLTYRITITVIYTYWNTTYQTYTKMQVYRVK